METIFDSESAAKLQQHYKPKDIAKMFNVSEKSVYRWVYEGRLQANKIGGSIRVPRTELLKIVKPL